MNSENVTKSKRGGKREGAGRKPINDYSTIVMRVPSDMQKYVSSMIDMYVDWLHEADNIKERTTPGERLQAVRVMEELIRHERERQLKAAQENDDKRQMRLFRE